MIDPEQLRQLGWSEELIAEVCRTREDLVPAERMPTVEGPRTVPASVSGSELVWSPGAVASSAQVRWRR